jgi:hypothetical protein
MGCPQGDGPQSPLLAEGSSFRRDGRPTSGGSRITAIRTTGRCLTRGNCLSSRSCSRPSPRTPAPRGRLGKRCWGPSSNTFATRTSSAFWDEGYGQDGASFLGEQLFAQVSKPIENNLFGKIGRGNWLACVEGVARVAFEWKEIPWERVTKTELERVSQGDGQGSSSRARA